MTLFSRPLQAFGSPLRRRGATIAVTGIAVTGTTAGIQVTSTNNIIVTGSTAGIELEEVA